MSGTPTEPTAWVRPLAVTSERRAPLYAPVARPSAVPLVAFLRSIATALVAGGAGLREHEATARVREARAPGRFEVGAAASGKPAPRLLRALDHPARSVSLTCSGMGWRGSAVDSRANLAGGQELEM